MKTVEDVHEALTVAVEDYGETWEDPNASTGGCTNEYRWREGWRNCIAGHVFKQWGWDWAFSAELNNHGVDDIISSSEEAEIESDAQYILQMAQEWQDSGLPWGVVLERAKALDV